MKISKDIYLVGAGDFGLSNKADCHVFLIDGGNVKVLIDAGVGINHEEILNNIREDGVDPKSIEMILITHSHADHAGGAKFLKEYTGAELIAPEKEAEFIEKGGKDFEISLMLAKFSKIYPKDYRFEHVRVDKTIGHNEKIIAGKYTIRAIQVPGHSHSTTAYLIEEEPRSLFSTDIVFLNGTIGLGNWPGCDLNVYRKYIKRLANLRVTMLFPGHFGWTLREGQLHINQAIKNLKQAWVPPAWTHLHPHR
jgi:glyoxylase-like metal-dependent hydrolase (beta-lactamase superfamily II)